MSTSDSSKDAASNESSGSPTREKNANICNNCDAVLAGPFCHQCGQPSKSIIRFFGSLISELFDDIIRLDSRAFRTLSALLFKPGYLTNEYIRGRRYHYVSPLRLFLFSSILCFFVLWLVNWTSDADSIKITDGTESGALQLPEKTLSTLFKDRPDLESKLRRKDIHELSEEERRLVKDRIQEANEKLKSIGMPLIKLDQLSEVVQTQPTQEEGESDHDALKIKEQSGSEENKSSSDSTKEKYYSPSKKESEAKVNVEVSWLSEEEKNRLEEKLKNWVEKIKADPKDFIGDMLELIPKTMLFLLPIFALMMRLSYPFAHRYYIEHTIHAIHGHAFLFLSIMAAVIFELIGDGLANSQGFFLSSIRFFAKTLEIITLVWIPVYFLLALREVYRQAWWLTTFKWVLLGVLYCILFATGTVVVLLSSALLS